MRLNRYLAACGLGSRRACEALICAGRVMVNDQPVDGLAFSVAEGDRVAVDGRVVRPQAHVYVLLNKPPGVVCSSRDERGRRSCVDLVGRDLGRLYTVGRLDMPSEGLILLTNHGALAQRMMHPSFHLEKEYRVEVSPSLGEDDVERLRSGVRSDGERLRAHRVEVRGRSCTLVLREGRNRQVRRMMRVIGRKVHRLRRIRLGPLRDPGLERGGWRLLTASERKKLLGAVGLSGEV